MTKTTATNNQIILGTYDRAYSLNKMRTFNSVYRATLDEMFSDYYSRGYRNGMTFGEWAAYQIWDTDHGMTHSDEQMAAFAALARKKGIYAEHADPSI